MQKCLFLIVSVLSMHSLSAQVQFGVRAGAAFSKIENNVFFPQLEYKSGAETDFYIGKNAALFVAFPLVNKLSLQVEGNFLEKGGTIKEDFVVPSTGIKPVIAELETKYVVSTLEFPVLLKYKVLDAGLGIQVMLGGSYGYALSQKFEGDNIYIMDMTVPYVFVFSGEGEQLDWDTEIFPSGDFNRSDISGVTGLVLEGSIGKQQLLLDLRYLHDFTDWRTEKIGDDDRAQVRHRSFVVSLGIGF